MHAIVEMRKSFAHWAEENVNVSRMKNIGEKNICRKRIYFMWGSKTEAEFRCNFLPSTILTTEELRNQIGSDFVKKQGRTNPIWLLDSVKCTEICARISPIWRTTRAWFSSSQRFLPGGTCWRNNSKVIPYWWGDHQCHSSFCFSGKRMSRSREAIQ